MSGHDWRNVLPIQAVVEIVPARFRSWQVREFRLRTRRFLSGSLISVHRQLQSIQSNTLCTERNGRPMPVVLITPETILNTRGPWVSVLEEAGLTVAYPEDPTFTRGLHSVADCIHAMKDASAVIAGGEYFTPEIQAALPKLRVIARAGVGYDRIDVPSATTNNIVLTITPTANHEGVAEQVFALLFAIAKNVIGNDARTRAGQWSSGQTSAVRGTTLGIVGLGRTGRSTAIRGRAFGMNVLAAESHPDVAFAKHHGIEIVNLETLLSKSDYVSLHCPHNNQTEHLFSRKTFEKMKKGSVLINTARGKLVNEVDLLAALESGQLSAAGLDVFESEPARSDNPLFALKNVVVSPHLGGGDKLSQENMAIEAATCIAKLYRGEWPTGAVVNDQLRDSWKW